MLDHTDPVDSDGYARALGSVLKEIREERQLSRWAVHEDSNCTISRAALTTWETGQRNMRIGTLGRLCAFYDVPTAVVLDRADARYRASLTASATAWHNQRARTAGAA
jgi:hypothetical protein